MYIQNPEEFIKQNPIDKLDISKAKEIYDKLVDDLNYHNYLYYVKSQPVISDYEYDLLFHYLEDLEKKFPELIRKDSPTQRLTSQVQSELKKAKHKYPLLSLENTYSKEEVAEKLEKIEKDVNAENIDFYIEPKYDGLSIELIYEDGYFQQAITM
jgi:DNA ligase (NAD+)